MLKIGQQNIISGSRYFYTFLPLKLYAVSRGQTHLKLEYHRMLT